MKQRILLVYTTFNTFVGADYKILSSEHSVDKYQFQATNKLKVIIGQLLCQFWFLLVHIRKYDSVYIWFGDYHSLLPVLFSRILGKKSYVVVGGYDVTSIPEFQYGSLYKPFRRFATYYSFRYATFCIPVVEKLEEKLHQFCPRAKSETVYTGYKFGNLTLPDLKTERAKTIVTVSVTKGPARFYIKGLDRVKELANYLPEFKFIFIGINESAKELFEPVPENIELVPPVDYSEVTKYYSSASFYMQLSRSEGLPNALCEAMLYGCIPVGTDIGGIPTAIENLGLTLKEWNPDQAAQFVRGMHNQKNRLDISNHIIKKFDIKYRYQKILSLVSY